MLAQDKFWDWIWGGILEFSENNCHEIMNVCMHIYSLLIQSGKDLLRYFSTKDLRTCSYSRSSVTEGRVK